jgi:hypothetical protein
VSPVLFSLPSFHSSISHGMGHPRDPSGEFVDAETYPIKCPPRTAQCRLSGAIVFQIPAKATLGPHEA